MRSTPRHAPRNHSLARSKGVRAPESGWASLLIARQNIATHLLTHQKRKGPPSGSPFCANPFGINQKQINES